MCGCEQHHDPDAACTCICDEHRNFERARDLAFVRMDEIRKLRAEVARLTAILDAEQDETAHGRSRGSWMQTFTGRKFFPLAAQVEDVDPTDIAHALSLICRYGGHVRRFYSVAEHCVLMSYAVPPADALWALLHDATEAYIGDMVRPLKQHMPEYRAVEDRLMTVIAARFGLATDVMPVSVKDADNRILLDERAALLSEPPEAWQQDHLAPLGVPVMGWMPRLAEWNYLDRLAELTGSLR